MINIFMPTSKGEDIYLRADKSQLFVFLISFAVISLFYQYIETIANLLGQILLGFAGIYIMTTLNYVFGTIDRLTQDVRNRDSELAKLRKELDSIR